MMVLLSMKMVPLLLRLRFIYPSVDTMCKIVISGGWLKLVVNVLQMGKDIVSFLSWAAEPEMEERKLVCLHLRHFCRLT